MVAVLVLAGIASAGCGSSSGGGGGGGGSSHNGVTTPAKDVAYAKAQVAKYAGAPKSVGITQPLKYSPAGKLIDFVACSVPVCTTIGQNVEAAATVLHMKVNIIQAGTTPASMRAAFDKVVQDRPAALMDMNIAPDQWETDFKTLCRLHTVILINNVSPNTPSKCITAYVFDQANQNLEAQQNAFKIIADSNGTADVVRVNTPDLGFQATSAQKVWDQTMKKYCPGCTLHVLNVNSSTVGGTLPSTLVAYLQSNPDIKYAFAYFGDIFIGVPAALKAAGITDVQLYSSGGDKTEWGYIENHEQVADLALLYPAYGYQIADIVARASTGQPFVDPFLPSEWLTQKNINTVNVAGGGYPPMGFDYKSYLAKLWSKAKPAPPGAVYRATETSATLDTQ